ncbi:hypothetical protein KTH44_16255 [Acinetobacter bereziniae]|uniref:hypothetical protein n=1 Tax=Acinetobacter bereziniae TaxID=106648 RepID=UPI0021CDE0E7|nr:hypothetical protein [Acinetobacter bereziniae]MCU4320670.1 hypothetical protein [Acinetobacter bereziniae]
MTIRVLTPRECVQQAIGKFILDFRRWLVPETKLLSRWKTQHIAYTVAEGRMVNDFNTMLESYRKKNAELPMLLLSVQQIASPPELSQVVGTPFEVKTVIKHDPLKRRITLRSEPRTYHVQFVFLANDPDSANGFTSQFCNYIRLMEKRRIKVNYFLSPDLRDEWDITIFDNSLYPDKADIEEPNIVAGLLDFEFSGLTPRVMSGLPPLYEDEFTNPEVTDPKNPYNEWSVVIEADLFKDRPAPTFVRVNANVITGEITEQNIKK